MGLACAAIVIGGFQIGVRVLTKLGEVGAQCGLQLLVVEGVLDLRQSILQGWNAGLLMVQNLEKNIGLLGVDDVGDFAGLQIEGYVLNLLGELTALEHT